MEHLSSEGTTPALPAGWALPSDRRAVRVYRQICQECCPFVQKFSVVAGESDYAAREAREAIPTTDGPALVDLMRMGEDEWDTYTRGTAMRRAGYAGLWRNVAIALGNWLAVGDAPDLEAVGELVAALSDEDPVVAGAAAWALGRAKRDP